MSEGGRDTRRLRDAPAFILQCAVRRMPRRRREWGAAMQAELEQIPARLDRWRFALGCAGVALSPPGEVRMSSRLSANPTAAALAGAILALPLFLIAAVAAFQIEPLHGLLKDWSTAEDGVRQTASSFIALLAAFLLLPAASAVTLTPAVRAARAGAGLAACRLNLLLGLGIAAAFFAILGAVVADQLPCFLGQPNCD